MDNNNLSKKEQYDIAKAAKQNVYDQAAHGKSTKRTVLWVSVIGILAVSLWGLTKLAATAPNDDPLPTATALQTLSETDWKKGDIASSTVLIEYSDFQCPACAAYYPILKQLEKEHGDRFAFGYRHFPLSQHQQAKPAAYAAEAAGKQGKFWEMHDMIFERQSAWAGKRNADDIFLGYARTLNLDIDQFEQDRKSKETREKVDADYASGIANKVQATPTFFLNGIRIQPRSYDDFVRLLPPPPKPTE
jgi:protein-disulfide isomerase